MCLNKESRKQSLGTYSEEDVVEPVSAEEVGINPWVDQDNKWVSSNKKPDTSSERSIVRFAPSYIQKCVPCFPLTKRKQSLSKPTI